jgi:RNA polymerase sigma-70 factor (ECF subfamily)
MSNRDDLHWITQFTLLGDNKAFEKLVGKYQSPIRRFFLNLTMGDASLSDDLAQETFIKAFVNVHSFQALSNFSTWLYRIAYNVFYDSMRTQKQFSELDVREIDLQYQSDNAFSAEKLDFYNALQHLKKEEQTVLILHYMEDKTQKEIAKIMNCPEGTVKTYLLKGKNKLMDYLNKEGYDKK